MSHLQRRGAWKSVAALAVLTLLSVVGPEGPRAGAREKQPTCFGSKPTIMGSEKDDKLRGTPGPDVIIGLGGDDEIFAFEGPDQICGGAGDDYIDDGLGPDEVDGGEGMDACQPESVADEMTSCERPLDGRRP